MYKYILLLIATVSMSCVSSNDDNSSQDKLLESYIGQLTLDNVKTMTYQRDGISTHMSKFNTNFINLFEEKAQYLDEQHRADYFITGMWLIPLDGGEISAFADTVALKDCSNKYLFNKLDYFLANKENGMIYQKGQYMLVEDIYSNILANCEQIKRQNESK